MHEEASFRDKPLLCKQLINKAFTHWGLGLECTQKQSTERHSRGAEGEITTLVHSNIERSRNSALMETKLRYSFVQVLEGRGIGVDLLPPSGIQYSSDPLKKIQTTRQKKSP